MLETTTANPPPDSEPLTFKETMEVARRHVLRCSDPIRREVDVREVHFNELLRTLEELRSTPTDLCRQGIRPHQREESNDMLGETGRVGGLIAVKLVGQAVKQVPYQPRGSLMGSAPASVCFVEDSPVESDRIGGERNHQQLRRAEHIESGCRAI